MIERVDIKTGLTVNIRGILLRIIRHFMLRDTKDRLLCLQTILIRWGRVRGGEGKEEYYIVGKKHVDAGKISSCQVNSKSYLLSECFGTYFQLFIRSKVNSVSSP